MLHFKEQIYGEKAPGPRRVKVTLRIPLQGPSGLNPPVLGHLKYWTYPFILGIKLFFSVTFLFGPRALFIKALKTQIFSHTVEEWFAVGEIKKEKIQCGNRLKRLTDNVDIFIVAQMNKCCGDYRGVII